MRIAILTALALGAAVPMPASAQQAGAPASIDIRGVALGATQEQAVAALKAANMPAVNMHEPVGRVPRDGRWDLVRPGGHDDLTFLSTISSRTNGNEGASDTVNILFAGPPAAHRVWGVSLAQSFGPSKGPTAINTIGALADRYGKVSYMTDMTYASFRPGVPMDRSISGAAMAWYWDANGRLLGREAQTACEQPVHDTYLGNVIGGTMNPRNAVLDSPASSLVPAVRAGCSRAVTAVMHWDRLGILQDFELQILDLQAEVASAQGLSAAVKQRDAAKNQATQNRASGVKPNF